MAQFATVSYNCPKCQVEVFAFGALVGAVCLKCNGVEHWNPIMDKLAQAVSKAKDQNEALQIFGDTLHQNGIYEEFMELYGDYLDALRQLKLVGKGEQDNDIKDS